MAFEGGGFDNITGNFDDKGISLGAIQFTIGIGDLQPLLRTMVSQYPSIIQNIFGSNYSTLVNMLSQSLTKQLIWAVSINDSRNHIIEPWRSEFVALCRTTEFKDIQVNQGFKDYINMAYNICATYSLTTERALVLAFDIAVQDGSVKPSARAEILAKLTSSTTYHDKLAIIANAVANHTRAEYQADIRSRKMMIVNGQASFMANGSTYLNMGLQTIRFNSADPLT